MRNATIEKIIEFEGRFYVYIRVDDGTQRKLTFSQKPNFKEGDTIEFRPILLFDICHPSHVCELDDVTIVTGN